MLKVEREKRQSLMGHTEVEYRLVVEQKSTAGQPLVRVIASPHGITVDGHVGGEEELNKLAQMVGHGWSDYLSLKPKIVSPHAGH